MTEIATNFSRNLPAAALLAVLALILPADARAVDATCSFDAAARTARVDVGPGGLNSPDIHVLSTRELHVNDADAPGFVPPCAPMSELDSIVIAGAGGGLLEYTRLVTNSDGGPLGPGATDEPGDSDEVEIDATGLNGGVLMVDQSAAGTVAPSPSETSLGGLEINMNAEETDGIDADVVVGNVLAAGVQGDDLVDRVYASGGDGTAATPFARKLIVFARGGADELIGGNGRDQLEGGDGADQISGEGGSDAWLGGDAGADRISGGAGRDYLVGGPGVDRLDGGPGRDECDGGGGRTTFVSCETRG